jgi:hypothetical protein
MGGGCGAGFVECVLSSERSCHQSTFTFESGTTEGFAISALDSAPGATISVSSARAHTGSHSLAFPIESPTVTKWALANVTWCSQFEKVALEGATLAMWIYLDGGPLQYPATTHAQMMVFNMQSGPVPTLPIYNLPVGVWYQVIDKVPVAAPGQYKPGNDAQGLDISFGFPGGWGGTLYVDDITVTPAAP